MNKVVCGNCGAIPTKIRTYGQMVGGRINAELECPVCKRMVRTKDETETIELFVMPSRSRNLYEREAIEYNEWLIQQMEQLKKESGK